MSETCSLHFPEYHEWDQHQLRAYLKGKSYSEVSFIKNHNFYERKVFLIFLYFK